MSTQIELASRKNADLLRWEWADEAKQKWKKAPASVQEFYVKWRSSSETVLPQQMDIGYIPEFKNAPEQFFVRDCYKTTFDQIWQRAFTLPETGIVLTGQPGIGKTYFLWYALVRLIRQGQPVAFYASDIVYLFYDNCVWSPKAISISFPFAKRGEDYRSQMTYKPFLFVLIDQDTKKSEPDPDLVYGDTVFPIQASPPNASRFSIWSKRRKAGMWGLPLWNQAELNMALCLQRNYSKFKASLEEGISIPSAADSWKSPEEVQVALNTLKEWTEKKNRLFKALEIDDVSCEAKTKVLEMEENQIYGVDMTTIDGALKVLVHAAVQDLGPVARDIFNFIFYPEGTFQDQANVIAAVTYDDLHQLSKAMLAYHTFPDHQISHRIILVYPAQRSANDPVAYRRLHDKWEIDYRSVRTVREMARKLEVEKDERLAHFYELFRSTGQSSTLASWIHEHIAHRALCRGTRQELVLVKMQGDKSVDAPAMKVDFKKDTASKERLPGGDRLQSFFQGPGSADLTDKTYYVPQRSNFPLFDSFLVERRNKEVVLWVFQMSISPIHGGSRQGYASIRRIIEALKNPPSDDRDKRRAKKRKVEMDIAVKYVYVVPWETRTDHGWNLPPGWNEHNTLHNHQGEFYCLRLPSAKWIKPKNMTFRGRAKRPTSNSSSFLPDK